MTWDYIFAGTSWHCSYVSLGFQPVVWFLDLRPHRLVSEMIIATPQIRFPLWSWQGNQHAQCAAALPSDQAVRLQQPFYCDYTWVIWQLNQHTSANIRRAITGDHTTDYIYIYIIYIYSYIYILNKWAPVFTKTSLGNQPRGSPLFCRGRRKSWMPRILDAMHLMGLEKTSIKWHRSWISLISSDFIWFLFMPNSH